MPPAEVFLPSLFLDERIGEAAVAAMHEATRAAEVKLRMMYDGVERFGKNEVESRERRSSRIVF